MKIWIAIREREKVWVSENFVHLFLFYDKKLKRFLVLANQADSYSPLENQQCFNGLPKLEINKALHPEVTFFCPDALQISLGLNTRFVLEMHFKELHIILLYKVVNDSGLRMSALNYRSVSPSDVSMLFTDCSASFEIFHSQGFQDSQEDKRQFWMSLKRSWGG